MTPLMSTRYVTVEPSTLTPVDTFGLPIAHPLRVAANVQTYERRRAEAMGFEFSPVDVLWVGNGYQVSGSFICICGRQECYTFRVSEIEVTLALADPVEVINPARRLAEGGSFSREHLLADGYDEETVDYILAKGEEFDAENPKAYSYTQPTSW